MLAVTRSGLNASGACLSAPRRIEERPEGEPMSPLSHELALAPDALDTNNVLVRSLSLEDLDAGGFRPSPRLSPQKSLV